MSAKSIKIGKKISWGRFMSLFMNARQKNMRTQAKTGKTYWGTAQIGNKRPMFFYIVQGKFARRVSQSKYFELGGLKKTGYGTPCCN